MGGVATHGRPGDRDAALGMPVGNDVTWTYTSMVDARKVKDDKWQVIFTPAVLPRS